MGGKGSFVGRAGVLYQRKYMSPNPVREWGVCFRDGGEERREVEWWFRGVLCLRGYRGKPGMGVPAGVCVKLGVCFHGVGESVEWSCL